MHFVVPDKLTNADVFVRRPGRFKEVVSHGGRCWRVHSVEVGRLHDGRRRRCRRRRLWRNGRSALSDLLLVRLHEKVIASPVARLRQVAATQIQVRPTVLHQRSSFGGSRVGLGRRLAAGKEELGDGRSPFLIGGLCSRPKLNHCNNSNGSTRGGDLAIAE